MRWFELISGSVAELRRVEWPPRPVVLRHTVYIIVSVAIAALVVGLVDFLFTQLLSVIIR